MGMVQGPYLYVRKSRGGREGNGTGSGGGGVGRV